MGGSTGRTAGSLRCTLFTDLSTYATNPVLPFFGIFVSLVFLLLWISLVFLSVFCLFYRDFKGFCGNLFVEILQ